MCFDRDELLLTELSQPHAHAITTIRPINLTWASTKINALDFLSVEVRDNLKTNFRTWHKRLTKRVKIEGLPTAATVYRTGP